MNKVIFVLCLALSFLNVQANTTPTNEGINTATVNPLPPIEIRELVIKATVHSVVLNWETSSESNNDGFEIYRSADGRNFERLGWVRGAGNSRTIRSYEFTDKKVKGNKKYYYYLNQIDSDKRMSKSETVSVKTK